MVEPLSAEELAALERLAKAATPGPWKLDGPLLTADGTTQGIEVGAETPRGHLSVAWVMLGDEPVRAEVAEGMRDAAFLVRLDPDIVLRLIAMARREAVVCPGCDGDGGRGRWARMPCGELDGEPCGDCHGKGWAWKEGE